MPILSITKTYSDGQILTEADLDNMRTSIQDFINITGLDTINIQTGGIAASDIGINDSEYLEFGTGNDGRIGVVADDFIIENVTSNKDIIFKGSVSGVATEIFRLKASTSSLDMNNKKITGLANGTATTDAATYGQLTERVPVGVIQAYGGTTAPTGWLLCDGSAVSRTTYADLFAVIGITAGQGDGSTTFNVPDLRGRFLRGRDGGASRDPDAASRTAMNPGGATGDAVFSVQNDEFKSHTHNTNVVQDNTGGSFFASAVNNGDNTGDTYITSAAGGNETRPKNANVLFIIKY